MKNKILFILSVLIITLGVLSANYEKKFYKEIPIDSVKNFS